jgi:hypothetical protein
VTIKAYQKEEYLSVVLSTQITSGALVTTTRESLSLACHWKLVQHVQSADKKHAHYGYCSLRPRLNEGLALSLVDGRAYIKYQHVHLTEHGEHVGVEALWRIVPTGD